MPVVIGQFHIISNGIGKALLLFGVFFFQCFIDDQLQVFAQMRKFWITFGIGQRIGF